MGFIVILYCFIFNSFKMFFDIERFLVSFEVKLEFSRFEEIVCEGIMDKRVLFKYKLVFKLVDRVMEFFTDGVEIFFFVFFLEGNEDDIFMNVIDGIILVVEENECLEVIV